MTQLTPPIQAPFTAHSYGAGSIVIDKTGTIFQVWVGRLTTPGAWGGRVYRTIKDGKPELVWFIEDSNIGGLIILNKQLFIPFQTPKSGQMLQQIDGYIDPSDTPSSQVVNVDESSLNAIKQSVTVAQTSAYNADSKAIKAQKTADNAKVQIAALQAQVNALQAQILSKAQVEDIVWSKIWDVNYLIRQGYIAGSSTIREVQDYLVDLLAFIRRNTGK